MKKAEDAYKRALAKFKEHEQAVGDTEGADLLAAGGAMENGQEAPSPATDVGANEAQPAEPAKITEPAKTTERQTSVSPAADAEENVTVQVEREIGKRTHTSLQAIPEGANKADTTELGETTVGQMSVPLGAADAEENSMGQSKLELLTKAGERELLAGVQEVRHEAGKRKRLVDEETSLVRARKGQSSCKKAKDPVTEFMQVTARRLGQKK